MDCNAATAAERLKLAIRNRRFLLLVERERHLSLASKVLGLAMRGVSPGIGRKDRSNGRWWSRARRAHEPIPEQAALATEGGQKGVPSYPEDLGSF